MKIKVINNMTELANKELVDIAMDSNVIHGTWWFEILHNRIHNATPFFVEGNSCISVEDQYGAPEDMSDWLLDYGRKDVYEEYHRMYP